MLATHAPAMLEGLDPTFGNDLRYWNRASVNSPAAATLSGQFELSELA